MSCCHTVVVWFSAGCDVICLIISNGMANWCWTVGSWSLYVLRMRLITDVRCAVSGFNSGFGYPESVNVVATWWRVALIVTAHRGSSWRVLGLR